ncbi:MAG: hypothetical protein LBM13_01415, partial [Candidatus Ancillula sp.]|nr:hypothetical protein [Candidatus Ancillula sp.]
SAIRIYKVDGLDVVEPFEENQLPPYFSGTALFPWPNRLEDGKYTYKDVEYQASINEIDKNNQLHGYSQFFNFDLINKTDKSITTGLHMPAIRDGYPFEIYVEILYTLDADGLQMEVSAKNEGTDIAPFALGWHPWLSVRGNQDDAYLVVDANKYIVANDRLLPVEERAVEDTKFSVRKKTSLNKMEFDDAWVDPNYNNGWAIAELIGADGHKTTISMDQNYKAWQVCNACGMEGEDYRFAVAIEPMTTIANAFKDGRDLIELQPNSKEFKATWRIDFE